MHTSTLLNMKETRQWNSRKLVLTHT